MDMVETEGEGEGQITRVGDECQVVSTTTRFQMITDAIVCAGTRVNQSATIRFVIEG